MPRPSHRPGYNPRKSVTNSFIKNKNCNIVCSNNTRPAAHPNTNNTRPAAHPNTNNTRPAAHPNTNNIRPAAHPNTNNTSPAAHPNTNNTRPVAHPITNISGFLLIMPVKFLTEQIHKHYTLSYIVFCHRSDWATLAMLYLRTFHFTVLPSHSFRRKPYVINSSIIPFIVLYYLTKSVLI